MALQSLSVVDKQTNRQIVAAYARAAGEPALRREIGPSPLFDHDSKMTTRSAAKFCMPLLASFSHLMAKNNNVQDHDRSAVGDVRAT